MSFFISSSKSPNSPPSVLIFDIFHLSAYWSKVGVAWRPTAGRLPDVLLCRAGPRGLLEKELCAASADHLTQPLPASDPLLTGSPVCQGRKKHKQRGSVHPGAEHRTLFILSPMLLPESTILAFGWLYFKIQKYSPSPVRWEHLDAHSFFHWCFKDKPHQRSLKGSKGKTFWIHICLMSSWNSHTSGICLVT